jgi:hypothetical protein
MRQYSVVLSVLTLILGSAVLCRAQKNIYNIYPEVHKGLFVDNIRLKASPEDSVKTVDIIIENGQFMQIAAELEIPAGFRVISADTMYAYAGWIGMGTHLGLKKEETSDKSKSNNNEEEFHPGYPPFEKSGITPQLSVTNKLSEDQNSLIKLNEQGFCLVQVFPEGRMIPGRGAIIHTGESVLNDRIVNPASGLFAQFRGADNRVYPATDIGILALWKDLIMQARQAADHLKRYDFDPSTVQRPNYVRELKEMIPVSEGDETVYFKINNTLEAIRINKMAGDLDLKVCPVQLEEFLTNPLDLNNLQGLSISIDWPKDEKQDPEQAPGFDSVQIAELEGVRKAFLQKRKSLAMILDSAGIDFGFSLFQDKPDGILDNIRELYDLGMAESSLLRALTTAPAEIMGIEDITGTVMKGKMANLIITTKPVFEKKSSIKYMITEGRVHELEIQKKSNDQDKKEDSE